MKAVIMAGGEGTRLRPLTSNQPKPMMPLANRPMMEHIVRLLKSHGFEDIVVTLAFLPQTIRTYFGDGAEFGVRMVYATEETPLGTAGSVRNASAELDEPFLVISGDVLTDIDLTTQIAQHERTGATGTLALVPVLDPSSYGLVSLAGDGAVEQFLEKPAADTVRQTNLISAGAYVLERSVLELIAPGRNVSIEREVWPLLVDHGLYGYVDDDAYWIDVGTPDRYLQATFDILEGNVRTCMAEKLGDDFLAVDPSAQVDGRAVPPAVVGAGARIAEGAHVGSLAVLGDDVSVGTGSVIERAVVLAGAQIGEGCVLRSCIVGPGARVGDRTHVIGGAMLGDGAVIGADNVIAHGARLSPGMEVPDGGLVF